MMEYIVKGYLLLLTLSGLAMLGLFVLRVLKNRGHNSALPLDRALFLREGFHIVVGVILFALFSQGVIGVVTTLAVSALLLIGFEYALAIRKRQANTRSHLSPHRE